MGSTLILEFDKSIPDMTPEDLKKLLTPFMDFSRQRSVALCIVRLACIVHVAALAGINKNRSSIRQSAISH